MQNGVKIKRRVFGPTLEARVKPIFREKGTASFPRSHIIKFGIAIEDLNDVHLDIDTAEEYGFRREDGKPDTPLIGIQTAAYGGKFAESKVTELVEDLNINLLVNRWQVRFPSPAFPEENILYTIKANTKDNYLEGVTVSGEINSRQIVEMVGKVGEDYIPTPINNEDPIFTRPYSLNKRKLDKFYLGAGLPREEKVRHMHIAGYITSAMLELLRVRTLEKSGVNLRMIFDILTEAKSDQQVDIHIYPENKDPCKKTTRKGKYIYNIRSIAFQNSQPIMAGNILCGTEYLIDLRS